MNDAERFSKIAKAEKWIEQKLKIFTKVDESNQEVRNEESSEEWYADTTGLLFLLLGKEGVIRRFANPSEFGRIVEQLTKHKAKKLAPNLKLYSEDNFFKMKNAKVELSACLNFNFSSPP